MNLHEWTDAGIHGYWCLPAIGLATAGPVCLVIAGSAVCRADIATGAAQLITGTA
jgi:hypothetical protein